MLLTQSATEVRANFKATLDQVERGSSIQIQRGGTTSALVNAEYLRTSLLSLVAADVEIACENDEWIAFLPNIPSVLATGDTLDEAIADLISAMREYAFDWNDHLFMYQNHSENWGFVQIVLLSTDEQLKDWLAR